MNPARPSKTLSYGNYGAFFIMGNAGFVSSTLGFMGLRDVEGLGFPIPHVKKLS